MKRSIIYISFISLFVLAMTLFALPASTSGNHGKGGFKGGNGYGQHGGGYGHGNNGYGQHGGYGNNSYHNGYRRDEFRRYDRFDRRPYYPRRFRRMHRHSGVSFGISFGTGCGW